MSSAHQPIPSDPAVLKDLASTLQAENSVLKDEVYAKTLHIEKLKAELAMLRRARYGRSSEKLDGEIEQLELLIGDVEEGEAERTARVQALRGLAAPQKRER